ncbi:alanine--tRNA ligase [Campylobacter ureolyticus]|uniref:Alanine--tRNA ligase n=1 Tax=Campylobacter ureolyticus TaxID=827 RepID=A0A9Q4KPN8_9BACT|nr:alanine--tRNA ligase [Campylobacter ureolyticus]MCZ6103857.1 alanine--tRNA ligase [Campylobacter ureolyticus]MCZ6134691.1 alanine--tRNA ligase [Campylobacter ureolyticus]MCZ6161907.1 alanine--tRNA ligase [Campylobacter ureolyticus]MCZ6171017.1 alanine--tRNA ligase [Campylobacter ureolyticus]MDU4982121.1 alanine--tRNA ligase [Campylobacter ureolyticus]
MDVRKAYLDFFKSKGHEVVPSATLVPNDDSLLFTNAGMVPFKDIFTGKVPRPTPPIRTSCQTCIRAGGKHNDLDNVGYTARHHTFFEMLGNFSFGEYFKKEAISYAWEFITEVLKLPKDRLYVTVHESDDEAYEIWQTHIDKERIYKFGDKDNFWAMGETGPCGPCSEIFYDQGSEKFHSDEDYMGGDGDRFLEIWNLVFMQFEKDEKGNVSKLPKPSIDTGMGLERVVAIKEGVFSNFDSSLFMPIIKEIENLVGVKYEYDKGASYRVIADHIRSTVFLLAQGTNFDKEGRGYVLRRILRRAVRHGYLLGLKEPFMYKLVDIVCEVMGSHYSYLNDKKEFVKELIKLEEERFYTTIASGIELFNEELKNTKDIFSGEVAFKLYDTYGFPLDLTADMLRESNLKVDEAKFDELMKKQKLRSKASWKGSGDKAKTEGDFKNLLEKFGKNNFVGYEKLECEAKILAILDENFKIIDELKNGENGWIMLDNTPFYATSGGQCGDKGTIGKSEVLKTEKFFDLNLSFVKATENFKTNQIIKAVVGYEREMIKRNHSATHLLHAALRKVLGDHISQAGSSVEASRLRFDFTHPKAMSFEEIKEVENLVNFEILKAIPAKTEILELNEAKKSGAIALFGEKYASKVRVLSFGDFSKELCGGTHVKNSSEIGAFLITKESGVSAGVRRIEAICSKEVINYTNHLKDELETINSELKSNEPLIAIDKLKNEIKELKNELKKTSNNKEFEVHNMNGVSVIVSEFDGDIKTKIDELKNRYEKVVVLLENIKDDKITLCAGVKNAPIKAGDLVKQTALIVGGNGGGRDDFATAGGKDISKSKEALKFGLKYIKEKLS